MQGTGRLGTEPESGGVAVDPQPIRVLLVHADPGSGLALAARLSDAEGIEIVRVVHNRSATNAAIEELAPGVLLVDLMLPGYRSIDIVRATASKAPQVRILALAPAEPPHDRIMLAAEAGALGYVCWDADPTEFEAAIRQVHQGKAWLPLEKTYEVLQEGAGELAVTEQKRRARLGQVILGLIPLTGLVAAITAYLWREYWSAIGVRVPDLGVDPTSRMIDVLVVLLMIIGIFGPLLFVGSWVNAIIAWIERRPRLSKALAKAQGFHVGNVPIGRILFNRWIAWVPLALLVVGGLHAVTRFLPLIMVLLVGPGVGIVLLATLMGADDVLPEALHLPHLRPEQALAFLAVVIILFLLILGTEVLVLDPDLQTDGLHGILAPQVLGFSAKPIMLYDLEEQHEPLGALYLGGNADLYVLYDPCTEVVRLIPVSLSRVEYIDEVICP
jgi:DNA-binding NarL/FixJ family response regulator